MLNSDRLKNRIKKNNPRKIRPGGDNIRAAAAIRYKKLGAMGEISKGIINELYSPVDSVNRFINLALHTLGEGSQSRQFLLESKEGVRKVSTLLRKLNDYAKKIEKEIVAISQKDWERSQ